jgi:hypothetical protein
MIDLIDILSQEGPNKMMAGLNFGHKNRSPDQWTEAPNQIVDFVSQKMWENYYNRVCSTQSIIV